MEAQKNLFNATISGNKRKVIKLSRKYIFSSVKFSFLILLAIRSKQFEIAQLLAEISVDKNKNKKRINNSLTAPFIYSVWRNNLEMVKSLVKMGANVNFQTAKAGTALHFAAIRNYPVLIKYLLKHGADATLEGCGKYNPGFTPLHHACEMSRFKIVKILAKHDSSVINPKKQGAIHPIHLRLPFLHSNITTFLMSYINNINLRFSESFYELRLDIFKCNFNLPNENPTLLHWAIAKGDEYMVQMLVKSGASLFAKTKSKITSLMIAAKGRSMQIFSLILAYNRNVNEKDVFGNTALHYIYFDKNAHLRYDCSEDRNRRMDLQKIHLLVSAEADATAKCSFGFLPNLTSVLDQAIYFGGFEEVQYLLYKTEVGTEQLDYSKVELAAYDPIAEARDKTQRSPEMINVLRNIAKKIQCLLVAFIINRNEIGIRATEDTLKKTKALKERIIEEFWCRGLYLFIRMTMIQEYKFLKIQKVGRSEITFWDFVIRDQKRCVKFMFNEDVTVGFYPEQWEALSNSTFYYYRELFKKKFGRAYCKRVILTEAIEIIHQLAGNRLSYDCREFIAYSMSNEELINFVVKFYPPSLKDSYDGLRLF